VKIVITGYPTYDRCVRAMRAGAWDFIPKTGHWQERTVESAVKRLSELQEEKELEAHIFEDWLPKNETLLKSQYANQYVAIRDGGVIASGSSMIALGQVLATVWKHEEKKPFILFVSNKEGQ
jgi:DNA-binding NtrC family response regulator